MTKKRKLNSKNPKYKKASESTEATVARKELIANATTRSSGGNISKNSTKVAVYAVWYE